MRNLAEILAFAAILAVALAFNASTSWAKPEYARRTRKECNFCHPPDSWNLNDAGKYYRDHKYSLQGYKLPAADKPADKKGKN